MKGCYSHNTFADIHRASQSAEDHLYIKCPYISLLAFKAEDVFFCL